MQRAVDGTVYDTKGLKNGAVITLMGNTRFPGLGFDVTLWASDGEHFGTKNFASPQHADPLQAATNMFEAWT